MLLRFFCQLLLLSIFHLQISTQYPCSCEKLALKMYDLSVLAALLFLTILVLITKTVTVSRNNHHQLPPSPPKVPFIGNLHQLGSLPHRSLHALSNKHGPLMLLKLGQVQTLVVSSPDIAREILRTHDHIFARRPSLKAARILLYGGRGVVFSPYGEYWRQIRRLCVNHLLSAKMVRSFCHVIEEEVACMVLKISETRSPINMSEVLRLFVNKFMCKVLFGDYFREEGRNSVICKLIEQISMIFGQISVGDFIPSLGWLDKLSGMEGRATKVFRKWEAVLGEIIEEHANTYSKRKEDADFLDILLALQNDKVNHMEFSLDREIIKAILVDMIAAGTDTTAIVLDWSMAELARNPGVMKKLQDEVRGIANTESAVITEEDLSRMSYMKAVIKEILRLHPPAPLMIPRESMDHCTIQGYEIPKKTRVIVNVWAIGRDSISWDAPEEFRPERFLGNPIDYRGHNFEFIPFGAGRRICPGMQFSVSTVELAFANLVKNFDWELPDGMKCEDVDMGDAPGITTRRRESLYLVAKPPKAWKDCKISLCK